MKKRLKPSLPNYIPTAEAEQILWLENYKVHLPVLGVVYGIPAASIAAALLAVDGLLAALYMLRDIRKWLSEWLVTNEQLQYDKPNDASVTPLWPKTPVWPDLPDPIQVNAWQPILETTKLFLATRNLTALDREALKLNPYEPAKRRSTSAENFDYPLIRLSINEGSVVVRTTRGMKYRGKIAKYVIDYNNDGTFVDLATSLNTKVLVPIQFPQGVSMMTWTIRAVYLNNGNEDSQWCPPASIVLVNNAPQMANGQVGQGAQTLERSVKNLLETNQPETVAS